MESNLREPLIIKSNVAAVKPIQQTTKLPQKSKLPCPGTRLPRPGATIQSAQPVQQQKRKASPEKENVSKRKRIDSAPPPSTAKTNSIKTSNGGGLQKIGNTKTAPRPSRQVATAVRPSKTTKPLKPVPGVPKQNVKTGVATRKPAAKSADTGNTSTGAVKSTNGGGKKRAAWDYKGRLEDVEEMMRRQQSQNTELQGMMDLNQERIHMLESQKQTLEVQSRDRSQEVEELQRKLRKSEDELYEQTRLLKRKVEELEFNCQTLDRQKSSLEGELNARQTEVHGLKNTVSELSSSQEAVKAELEVVKISLENANKDCKMKQSTIDHLNGLVKAQEENNKDLSMRLMEEESMRRKLHNTIQELKGNIRVFCRVRPLLGAEKESQEDIQHITFRDDKTLEMEKLQDVAPNETLGSKKTGNKYEFNFDRIFTPVSTQSEVFEEISQLVQSSLDGYNVCIFAYGQTGSGKTFTMEGPGEITPESQGMIPRAVEQVFLTAETLKDKGWEYDMEASFLEIYNETIRDLLGNNSEDTKHEIKMVGSNSSETYVTNLTNVQVKHQQKVDNLLRRASENRAVAETKCNERSSRSHSVFRLKISGHNMHTEERCTGVLNLIDLAGSERLKESGSQGARLKETLSINKSLSNLGNVIMALANKENHVPYRNSKLTHLLQNSLGGNSKTLMFVNVSPKEENFSETLNSLRFATKVNNCSIGTATKRIK